MAMFCYHHRLKNSPYMFDGEPLIDCRYIQPFGIGCWAKHSRGSKGKKIGSDAAYRGIFIGYVNTKNLFPNYLIAPYYPTAPHYGHVRFTKSVVFDSVDSRIHDPDDPQVPAPPPNTLEPGIDDVSEDPEYLQLVASYEPALAGIVDFVHI